MKKVEYYRQQLAGLGEWENFLLREIRRWSDGSLLEQRLARMDAS